MAIEELDAAASAEIVIDEGAGQPVLLLHGLGCNSETWGEIPALLADAHRVVAIDLPGFGGAAPLPTGSTLADFAGEVLHVMDDLGIRSACVVGHSMGAMVAQELYLLAPERVYALALCSTTSGLEPDTRDQNEQLRLAVEEFGAPAIAPMLAGSVFAPSFAEHHPEKVAEFATMFAANNDDALIRAMVAADNFNVSDRLVTVTVPTLVYVGAFDAFLPDCRKIAARISGAQLVEIADGGHMAPMEDPAHFVASIERFLAKEV
jgi:pimeloyl-ACP methyl ester carboxylesterase